MTPKSVLIVDDAVELGRLLKATLNTLDRTLDIAVVPSAEEGMLEVDKKPVDLLVTDLRLPGVSGVDLVKKIRKKNPKITVILITGISEEQINQESKDVKVDFILRKPMEIAEFLEAAKKCLGMAGQAGEDKTTQRSSDPRTEQASKFLEELRKNLNAFGVSLFDEQGKVIFSCGEYPEKNFEAKFIPAIQSALLADARVLHQFNPPIGDGIHAFINPTFNLVVATVNDYALVAILRPEPGHSHMLMAMGAVIDTQRELIKAFSGNPDSAAAFSTITRPAMPKETKPGDQVSDFDFKEKIQKTAKGVKKHEADQFWNEVSETLDKNPSNLDGITFEDAQKQGLVGKGDEIKK